MTDMTRAFGTRDLAARRTIVLAVTAAALAACGSSSSSSATTTSTLATTTTTASTTTTEATSTVVSSTAATTTQSATSAPTTAPVATQPALWPAPGVVFTTPEAAASDFVSKVLGVPPVLGAFQQGDSRSGEIEVFSPGEGGATKVPRGLLFLRQLGAAANWFVIGAGNDAVTIASPQTGDSVPAGPLTVSGMARGFEASVMATAFNAGVADPFLAQQHTMAGNLDQSLPYSVVLDLSHATPGSTVFILVKGGVGLETDPGEFSAIPVVIAG